MELDLPALWAELEGIFRYTLCPVTRAVSPGWLCMLLNAAEPGRLNSTAVVMRNCLLSCPFQCQNNNVAFWKEMCRVTRALGVQNITHTKLTYLVISIKDVLSEAA